MIRLSRIVFMVRGSEGLATAVNFYHGAIGLPVLRVTDDWAELLAGTMATSTSNPTTNATATATRNDSNENSASSSSSSLTFPPLLLNLQAVSTEPQLSTGYSPLLTFEVPDMDATIQACILAGGHLDGPIQYPAHGKVAALRAPCGHMIGLYEPTTS